LESKTSKEKQRIRKYVWRLLEERGVATFPRPVYGRIPNFKGADEAAARLSETPEWRKARIVKVNPDAPQKWVRLAALRSGKIVVMATPRLREGFLLLDPRLIPESLYEKAATIRGAFQLGKKLSIDELRSMGSIDLIVTGSVAIDRKGHRIGKGEGYAEIEYGIMRDLGLVGEDVLVATTIHDLQLVDYIPREPYDLAVDIAATPRRLLRFESAEKPPGIIWDMLPCKKFREIPILQDLARLRNVEKPCRK